MTTDLARRETHFEFGENWLSFVNEISDARVLAATRDLERLIPASEIRGRRFLDIGSGSGLSMLAALRLGAREVVGIDIDENSVAASQRCLGRLAPGSRWQVFRASVFDLDVAQTGSYDVVHSWGVLHHTGAMWAALDRAAALVSADGLLVFALYLKTPFCGFWRAEKYFYSRVPGAVQAPIRWIYEGAGLLWDGASRTRRTIIAKDAPAGNDKTLPARGMSRSHDTHDWLGGYPYESATAAEVHDRLGALGFGIVRENLNEACLGNLFGSTNNEYVARRRTTARPQSAAAGGERTTFGAS
ncbi:MAG TPA: class I SAM-dependent methyltransferase [Gammaproteobacteria bacterium]|nr:class I SAM-dependent methyltransferase [Gammaproteobacteria bacterium]